VTVIGVTRSLHLTDTAVHAEVVAALGVRPITDAAALTIAAWWSGPAGQALILADLALAGLLDTEGVLEAITDVLVTEDPGYYDTLYLLALQHWTRHKATAAPERTPDADATA
jgi:hypothetical protein